LPLPPSTNNLYVNLPGRGRVRAAAYRRWSDEAGWLVKAKTPPVTFYGAVAVRIEAGAGNRRDIDNILKPTLDLLVKVGVLADDRMIDVLHIMRGGPKNYMLISIWPMEEVGNAILQAQPGPGADRAHGLSAGDAHARS
jgi:Holliday junction resolvase RusA-like endonuclease